MFDVIRNMFSADQRDSGTVTGLMTGFGSLPLASWLNNLMDNPQVADAVQVATGEVVSTYLLDPKVITVLAIASMVLGFARAGQPGQPEPE